MESIFWWKFGFASIFLCLCCDFFCLSPLFSMGLVLVCFLFQGLNQVFSASFNGSKRLVSAQSGLNWRQVCSFCGFTACCIGHFLRIAPAKASATRRLLFFAFSCLQLVTQHQFLAHPTETQSTLFQPLMTTKSKVKASV